MRRLAILLLLASGCRSQLLDESSTGGVVSDDVYAAHFTATDAIHLGIYKHSPSSDRCAAAFFGSGNQRSGVTTPGGWTFEHAELASGLSDCLKRAFLDRETDQAAATGSLRFDTTVGRFPCELSLHIETSPDRERFDVDGLAIEGGCAP